jgi:hypothetical protein
MAFKFDLKQKDLLLNDFIKKHPKYTEKIRGGVVKNNYFYITLTDDEAFEIGNLCLDEFLSTLDDKSEPTGNGAMYDDINQVLALDEEESKTNNNI